MAWPLNAETLQGIAKSTFYANLQLAEADLIYPKICAMIDQPDLTTTYVSFGGVPEPRAMSGSVAAGGGRMERPVKDYKVAGTVVEFETTATLPRSVIETNPGEIGRITSQMAQKCALYLDRRFIATALPSTTALGYDGSALYSSTTHTETGAAQDNDNTVNIVLPASPTAAEMESAMATDLAQLKAFTDDTGTPINAHVNSYDIICHTGSEAVYRAIFEPLKGQVANYDVGGGTGRYRGMFTVHATPFIAAADRHYMFARRPGANAMAFLKNRDWDFKTNIGTDSDIWNYNQTALFTAYGRFEFIPWDWKVTLREVWT